MSKEFFSVFQNAISAETCSEIIRRFEASPDKQPGRVGDGSADGSIVPEIKKTTELILDGHPEWEDVMTLLKQSLRPQLPEYLKRWGGGTQHRPAPRGHPYSKI